MIAAGGSIELRGDSGELELIEMVILFQCESAIELIRVRWSSCNRLFEPIYMFIIIIMSSNVHDTGCIMTTPSSLF